MGETERVLSLSLSVEGEREGEGEGESHDLSTNFTDGNSRMTFAPISGNGVIESEFQPQGSQNSHSHNREVSIAFDDDPEGAFKRKRRAEQKILKEKKEKEAIEVCKSKRTV